MKTNVINTAIQTIKMQAESIAGISAFINDDFENAVNEVYNSTGRLVISGIGKSAIIAQKITATLNSTGTPSLFMHAADAIHGDLGMVQKGDVVMLISKSGESPEIKVLVPLIRNFGNILIGMAGNQSSYLARNCHYFLNTTVSKEACPNNLAPTTSTTAQMVMGDALAICLMNKTGFTGNDFARFHPGGNLGKRLYMRVADVYKNNEKPEVNAKATLREVILEMSKKRLGATVVVDNEKILGVITDGDLRRMLENTISLEGITADKILSPNPKTIQEGELAVNALEILRQHDISQIIVTDTDNCYLGVLHLHDLIREGIV